MCNAPTNLQLKKNDISFVPSGNGVFVYEFLLRNGDVTIKVPVSTPDSFKNGRFHYTLNGANYGQLGASSGTKISVRGFCEPNYWAVYPTQTNYDLMKDQEDKFSAYSNEVLFK